MSYHPQVCLGTVPSFACHGLTVARLQPGFQYSPSTFSSSQRQQQPTMANILNHQDSYSVSATTQQQLVGDEEYKCVLRCKRLFARMLTRRPFCSRLLKNYKLAHLRIEEQRSAMLEQEKQVRLTLAT